MWWRKRPWRKGGEALVACVCLPVLGYVCEWLLTCMRAFMHERVCVRSMVGTASAIYRYCLTKLLAVCLQGTERHLGSPSRPNLASQCYVTAHATSRSLSSSVPPRKSVSKDAVQYSKSPCSQCLSSEPCQVENHTITWKSRLSEDALQKVISHSEARLMPWCEDTEFIFREFIYPQCSVLSLARRANRNKYSRYILLSYWKPALFWATNSETNI